MHERTFGRTAWHVGELGYGMWGLGGWSGSDDDESMPSLQLAVDAASPSSTPPWPTATVTASGSWASSSGPIRTSQLYTATKIPPKNRSGRPVAVTGSRTRFRPTTSATYTEQEPGEPRARPSVDLLQFHVWEDDWADDECWQRAVDDLRATKGWSAPSGSASTAGSRGTSLRTVRTGLCRRRPGDLQHLRPGARGRAVPRLPRARTSAVIARVPFDEGSLTGTLTLDTTWPDGRLAQHLLRRREPAARRSPTSRRSVRSCRPG